MDIFSGVPENFNRSAEGFDESGSGLWLESKDPVECAKAHSVLVDVFHSSLVFSVGLKD